MDASPWRNPAVKPQVQAHVVEDFEGQGGAGEVEMETMACLPDAFESDGTLHGGAKRLAVSHNLEIWWLASSNLLIVRAVACDARLQSTTRRFAHRLFALLRLRYRLETLS
jgi:hypothetical protein